MRTLLPHKSKHYKNFAEAMHRQYKKLRYGIDTCKASIDDELASIRKELVDWEANEDDGALETTAINYRTWLAVSYDDVLYSKGGRGYIVSEEGKSAGMALGYNGTVNAGPNIIVLQELILIRLLTLTRIVLLYIINKLLLLYGILTTV